MLAATRAPPRIEATITHPPTPESDKTFDGPALDSIEAPSTPPSRATVTWRRFGYLGMTVVWALITVIVLFLLAALPAGIAAQGDLADAPGLAELAVDNQWIALLIVVPLFAVLMGTVVVALAQGALSLTFLSLIAFCRSLRSSFAHERLTTTRWTGEAIGPVRFGVAPAAYAPIKNKAALSLVPVRRTGFSAFWTAAMLFAFAPSFRVIAEASWLGLAYLVTVVWVLWPVTGPLAILGVVVSLALTGLGVWRVARARRLDAAEWTTQPA